jgi:hypothetical protein
MLSFIKVNNFLSTTICINAQILLLKTVAVTDREQNEFIDLFTDFMKHVKQERNVCK